MSKQALFPRSHPLLALLAALLTGLGLLLAGWFLFGPDRESTSHEDPLRSPVQEPARSAEGPAPTSSATSALLRERLERESRRTPAALGVACTALDPRFEPLAEARLTLLVAGEEHRDDADASGRCELLVADPPFSRVRAIVSAPGFRSHWQDLDLPSEGVVDLGTVVLSFGPTLTGQVLEADSRRPVPDAQVVLRPRDPDDDRLGPELRTLTDANGAFRLESVEAGMVRIEVRAPGFASALLDWHGVDPDETRNAPLEFELRAASELSGAVADEVGQPVSGAEVTAERTGAVVTCFSTVRSDAGGRFHFEDLEAGYYQITVDHPRVIRCKLPRAHTGVMDLAITATRCGSLELDLPETRSSPGAHADLLLLRLGPDERVVSRSSVRSVELDEGRLRLDPVAPGRYQLEFRVHGTAPGRTSIFEIFPGSTTALGEWRLDPGAAVTGRVLDAKGQPLSALVEVLRSGDSGLDSFFEGAPYDRRGQCCDASGHFELTGLPPGEALRLRLRAPGHAESVVEVAALESGETRDLGDLALATDARLEGTIRDRDGEAIPGAAITLSRGPRRFVARSDAAGRYGFDGLPPGRFELLAVAPDDAPRGVLRFEPAPSLRRVVEVESGGTTTLDLRLEEPKAKDR